MQSRLRQHVDKRKINFFYISISSTFIIFDLPTMDNMFEQGIEEFIKYEREGKQRPTRNQKRKIKVTKLKADLEDPEQKKKRHQERRQLEKAKLQKQLEGMNEEEARVYLDNKKQQKKIIKERNLKALEHGTPILLDLVYEDQMNDKQNKSLAIQIELIMKSLKHLEKPPGIHLCSVLGGIKAQLEKMNYKYWTLTSSEEDVVTVAKKMGKNPVYLSPDAPSTLDKIDPDAAYIIGGLVDRTVIKNASFRRAEDLGIPSVQLPIRDYMKNRYCLNLDHVVTMLAKFEEVEDWKLAFDYAAPKRWKKETSQKKQTANEEEKDFEQKILSKEHELQQDI